jgi:hypothetical protein
VFDLDTNRRRDPQEIDPNTVSMTRFALLSAFSMLLASMWPSELFAVMLAGFLFINALTSAFVAMIKRQPVWSPHLTRWDEAAAFYVFAFVSSLFIDTAALEAAMNAAGAEG